jgi:hypothetical protein
MGLAIVFLLAAILCAMLFGPTPVLVLIGIGIVYATLLFLAAALGNLGAVRGKLGGKQRQGGREPFFGEGWFLLHLYAALAEKERAVISQRTKAALAAAKGRGQSLGNPRLSEARAIANAAHKAGAELTPPLYLTKPLYSFR